MNNSLLGVWKADIEDPVTRESYGNVTIEFHDSGELIYSIIENGNEQKMFLTYKVNDNLITTDQISSPAESVTEFEIDNDVLILNFGNIRSRYVRVR